jgi:predicted nucleotidyltransferase
MDLREMLGRNVDVVTERGLKTRIRDRFQKLDSRFQKFHDRS